MRIVWKNFYSEGKSEKHNIVQHSNKSVEERKRFRWNVCEKGYKLKNFEFWYWINKK